MVMIVLIIFLFCLVDCSSINNEQFENQLERMYNEFLKFSSETGSKLQELEYKMVIIESKLHKLENAMEIVKSNIIIPIYANKNNYVIQNIVYLTSIEKCLHYGDSNKILPKCKLMATTDIICFDFNNMVYMDHITYRSKFPDHNCVIKNVKEVRFVDFEYGQYDASHYIGDITEHIIIENCKSTLNFNGGLKNVKKITIINSPNFASAVHQYEKYGIQVEFAYHYSINL